MSTQEQNTPMKIRKPSYRELQFRRWIKEEAIDFHSDGIRGLLQQFNDYLWHRAKNMSKSPLPTGVNLFAIKKWVSHLQSGHQRV